MTKLVCKVNMEVLHARSSISLNRVCVCGLGRANSVSTHDVSRHTDRGLTESDFDESDSLCLTIKARKRRATETEVRAAAIIEPHL